MNIIGLNVYHADSSAALLSNGQIIAATEEERFTRVKHWAGVPIQSINYCLEYGQIQIRDVNAIVIGRDVSSKWPKKISYVIKNLRTSMPLIRQRLLGRKDLDQLENLIIKEFGYCPQIVYVEHHRAHLASAFYSSPYNDAAILSVDGAGDFTTVMFGEGHGNSMRVFKSIDFPVSIGLFYTACTQYLGFPYYGDEYKVMGLSPYGEDIYAKELEKIIWVDSNGELKWKNEYFNISNGVVTYPNNVPTVTPLYNKDLFEENFGISRGAKENIEKRHKDFAASVQRHTERLIFDLCKFLYKESGKLNLTIAGGVAQNSVANGKIIENTPFQTLYIPSAGHDAGIAMGAAQYYYFHILKNERKQALFNANLGISYTNRDIEKVLQKKKIQYHFYDDRVLFELIAKKLSEGKVVGYFDGRSEYGPRALGSRSILADPRNPKAKELLNLKIKKRESFRPFAPSILDEYGSEWFENYQFTPFMERVLKFKEDKRHIVPSVVHVDGSGRLQSVTEELKPRYHRLISEFYKITKVPILINTSFNENEPVVNHPLHALDTYLRTDLDVLVLGNFVLNK